MNWKQYSDCRRCLGVLEGLGTALRGTAEDLFNNTLIKLGDIIEELAPAPDIVEEKAPEEEASQEDDDPPRLWTKWEGEQAIAGASKPVAYAYGPSWVRQALQMGDVSFKTPEEAKAAWEEGRV